MAEIRGLMHLAQRQGVQEFAFVFPAPVSESLVTQMAESVVDVDRLGGMQVAVGFMLTVL